MAQTIKCLAQVSPAATTLTTLYTVPGSTSTTVSTLTVCNQNAGAGSFRISVQVAAAADNVKQYLYFDEPIGGNRSYPITLGITLAATDVVKCYASATNISFNLFGVEIS